jgi:adenylylsulfate kinase
VIDGDHLRELMPNPGYDREGRHINIDRAQAIAAYLDGSGTVDCVLVSLIAPYRKQREAFKETHDVTEVYVHTTDKRGREEYHVDDYEPPESNFIDIDTTGELATDSTRRLYRALATTTQGS